MKKTVKFTTTIEMEVEYEIDDYADVVRPYTVLTTTTSNGVGNLSVNIGDIKNIDVKSFESKKED